MRRIIVAVLILVALSTSARAVPQRVTWLPLFASVGVPWGGGDGYPAPR